MNNAREYEQECPAQAKRYDISFSELSNTKICVMAPQEEVNELMSRACEFTWPLGLTREYEKKAQDIARKYNLPIPKLSDVEIHTKVQEEVNRMMTMVSMNLSVDTIKVWVKKAQALAKAYNLPIPNLPSYELRIKARWQIQDHMMRACQYAVTVKEAREYEKAAQTMATEYELDIPKFSDMDIEIIKQREEAEE